LERDALKILSSATGMWEAREDHRLDISRPLEKRISTVVTTGFYMNSATRCVNESVYKSLSLLDVQRQLNHKSALDVRMVHIHPSSALAAMPGPEYLLYMQLAYTNKLYMQQICRADSKLLKRLQKEWKYVDPYVLCGRELYEDDQHSRSIESKDATAQDKGDVVEHHRIGAKRPLPPDLDFYIQSSTVPRHSGSSCTVASEISSAASHADPAIAVHRISTNAISSSSSSSTQQTMNTSIANAFLAKQRYLERKGRQ